MPEIEIPARQFRVGEISCARMGEEDADGADDRRVELSFSSEEPVLRGFGWEILGHAQGEVEIGRIASGSAPLLMDHRNSLDAQTGVIESVVVEGGRGRAVARFGGSARATELLARVRDKEVSGVSVGYRVHDMAPAGERDGVPVYRATSWEPLEISLVAVPADASVGVGRAAPDDAGTITIRMEQDMPKPNETKTDNAADSQADEGRSAQTPDATPKPAPAAPRDARSGENVGDERKRIADITATGRQFDMPDEAVDKAIRDGTPVADFQRAVLSRLATPDSESTRAGAARIGLSEAETQRFSFIKALRYLSNPTDRRAREGAKFELEVSDAAQAATGREAQGVLIPQDVLGQSARASDQLAGTANLGGNVIDEILLSGSFIDILRNTAALSRLGVRTLSGLTGDIAIPKQTAATTAFWLAEDGAPTSSAVQFGQVKMTPHTVGALTEISRKLMIQSSVDVEAMVRSDIAAQIALAIDAAGLNGAASADAPEGLNDTAGINTVDFATAGAPTYAETVDMWAQTAADNAAMGALAYATHPLQVAHLMTTPKFASGDTPIMSGMDTLNGYRNIWSNQVVAGEMWFGNWSDFVIGLWSGLDLTVDPYSKSDSGAVRVVAFQDVDFAVRHAESFTKGVLIV